MKCYPLLERHRTACTHGLEGEGVLISSCFVLRSNNISSSTHLAKISLDNTLINIYGRGRSPYSVALEKTEYWSHVSHDSQDEITWYTSIVWEIIGNHWREASSRPSSLPKILWQDTSLILFGWGIATDIHHYSLHQHLWNFVSLRISTWPFFSQVIIFVDIFL